ncbi:MAG TPA: sigma-54 dependent transcriptional regulator [Terriglobia bacterium]|jgi:DNA-binding NtrC family response regulator|nr:sigma-54 dependent transcriptional regulator [Terriglobia bacterium]
MTASVLVVDDEIAMRTALEANFRRQGWAVRSAKGKNEAIELFRSYPVPLVISDMRMPDGTGLDVVKGVRSIAPNTRVILLTAFANVQDAVAAMKEGASDYLIKPISFEELRRVAQEVLDGPQEAASRRAEYRLVGNSLRFRTLLDRARQAAQSDADVLIEAESGTGKELLARFIHESSPRSKGPFVAVNCAAFPDSLLESELFGHVKGAFTGASASKPGKFELAHKGTLLLDEIGEMPRALQPKLLRVLQEREVDRLGDTRPVRVDVRVIATTNRSLRKLAQEGLFRYDLYYRLNVVPLSVPPLRERVEDIPVLAEHFAQKYSAQSPGKPAALSREFVERLKEYDWPGNVRELENFVRRAMVLSENGVISESAFHDIETRSDRPASGGIEPGITLQDAEKELLCRTLEAVGGNRTRAAAMLGISLRTIRNKIREYGLPPREVA